MDRKRKYMKIMFKAFLTLYIFLPISVKCRNFIPYSGFDTGVFGLWESPYQAGNLVDNSDLDYKIFHDGIASLKLTTWKGPRANSPYEINIKSTFKIPIEKEGNYTFSAWVKSDNDLNVNIKCGSLEINRNISPNEGWIRVSRSGFLKEPAEIEIKVVSNSPKENEICGGHLWIDSLQLEEGEKVSEWEPAGIEIGLITDKLMNLFYEGEKVEITLRGINPTKENIPLRMQTILYDCFWNEIERQKDTFLLKGENISEKKFTFPSNRKGVFRFQVFVENEGLGFKKRVEIPFYVILKPNPYGWNPFGLYAQMTVPMIERVSKLGFYWNNLLSAAGEITEWYKVVDKEGNYLFDKYVPYLKEGKKYHLRYIGNISNSGFVENFPKFAEAEREIEGETIKFEYNNKIRYLKKSVFRDFIEKMAKAYKDYISYWQIIDEVPFNGKEYMELMKIASSTFKGVVPESKIFATYPDNMVYTFLRGGKEYVDGIYDLGRDLARIRYAVKAAEIASKDFPIIFYDCSILFNYYSQNFNGWGKLASLTNYPVEKEEEIEKIKNEFIDRLANTMERNIRAVGGGGKHTEAVILYHARIPGGAYQSAFDKWGHPCPSLIIFSIFNSFTSEGYAIGEIGVKGYEGFIFSLGKNKGYLVVIRPEKKLEKNEFKVSEDLNIKQLDLWTNEINIKKSDGQYIHFDFPLYSYLVVPEGQIEKLKDFLKSLI